jgi:hypothetical protein
MIQDKLPIRVQGGAVSLGSERFEGPAVAASFIFPNPLNTDRYVVVHTGVSKEALFYAAHLPELLPDYVVYDASPWGRKGGLVLENREVLTAGNFDKHWNPSHAQRIADFVTFRGLENRRRQEPLLIF